MPANNETDMEINRQITGEEEFETDSDCSSSIDSYEKQCRTENVDMKVACAYSEMNLYNWITFTYRQSYSL